MIELTDRPRRSHRNRSRRREQPARILVSLAECGRARRKLSLGVGFARRLSIGRPDQHIVSHHLAAGMSLRAGGRDAALFWRGSMARIDRAMIRSQFLDDDAHMTEAAGKIWNTRRILR